MHALLVIDMQKDFVQRLASETLDALCRNINSLMVSCSQSGGPVYIVMTEHDASGADALSKARQEGIIPAVKGSDGAKLVEGLRVPPGSIYLKKAKYSAFFDTELDERLVGFAGSLIMAGVNTHACVRATAIDACQRDYDVIVPHDCVASYDQGFHEETLRYLAARVGNVVSTSALLAHLSSDQPP